MKPQLFTVLLLAAWSPCVAQTTFSQHESTHSSSGFSSGSGTSSRSVTTTSDGKKTVKTTVTIVNGVKKVVTETTDENGKTTRTESGGEESAQSASPWIGLRVADVSKVLRNQLDLADNEGLVVEMVAKNSPAQQAKIEVGDLLLALGESPVSSPEQLSAELLNYKVGDKTKVTIMRKAKRVDLSIDLGKEPSNDVIKVPEILLENFGKGSIESVDLKTSGAGIESILKNPDIPDDFKASIRAMQKKLKEFEKKTD